MRQAMFAVVLVAASFAGGAIVNGPGLRWAQTQLMSRLGLDDSDDPASPNKPKSLATADGPTTTTDASSTATGDAPPRTIPPLVVDPSVKSARSAGPRVRTVSDSNTPEPAPAPAVAASLPPRDQPWPSPAPLSAAEPDAAGAPAPRPLADDRADRAAFAEGVSRLADPKPSPAPAEPAAAATDTPASAADPADWAGVRKALRDLGVSRYGTEGEPSGRARFHCVIPVAGRRAVGQHFEAEGEDELQAARATLRRIALWRATSEAP